MKSSSGSGVRTTMVQLPAVNTPQFEWVLNRMPGRARPVAPVFQPEVAARAIVHAASHGRRREYWVGGSTVAALIANAVAPGVLDRYLARTGFDSQQDEWDERGGGKSAGGPGNLWTPADGPHGRDFGAHGRFDDEAMSGSPQDWVSRNRGRMGAGLVVAGGLGAVVTAVLRRAGRRGRGGRGGRAASRRT